MRQEIRIAGSAALLAAVALVHCSDGQSTAGRSPVRLEDEVLAARVREAFAAGGQLDVVAQLAPLLVQLDRENVEEVRAVYDEYMASVSECELQPFFDAWTRFDGPAALGYALRIPFEYHAGIARRAAVQGWALRDPLAAKSAVLELLESRPKIAQDLPSALVVGWARAPEGGVEDFLLSVPRRSDLIGHAIGAVYRRDGPEGTLQWAQDLIDRDEDSERRWLTFRQAVRHAALRRPELAVPFVLERYGKYDYARDGPRVLAEAWLRRDPIPAFDWLRTEAPPESRDEAVAMAFTTWQSRDRAGAIQWLESRPVEPFYYPAFDSAARRRARHDPEGALGWCERIPEGDQRTECLGSVARLWYRRDPVAAGSWMEESILDEETRETIRMREERRKFGTTRRERRLGKAEGGSDSEEGPRGPGPHDDDVWPAES